MNELEKRLVEICEAYLSERDSKNRHLKIDKDFANSRVTINCFEDAEFYGHQIHSKILGSITVINGKNCIFNPGLDETFESYITRRIELLRKSENLTDYPCI